MGSRRTQPRVWDGIGRAIAGWVGWVSRRPALTTLGVLLLAAGSLYYAPSHLGMRGDTESLFAPDLPFKQIERRYYDAFPQLYENLFIVIDAVTPERAGEAATALYRRLRSDTEHFRAVYLPGGGEFFETNAFLYLDTPELEELADSLARAQPYLAELSRDGSLRGLASMLARGVRAVREGDVSGDRLIPIFERMTRALDAARAGERYHVSWAEVIGGGEFAGDARRRFLLAQPVLNLTDLQPAKESILAARRAAEELGLGPDAGVTVRITGDVALSFEEMETVRDQAAQAGLLSLVLVGVILALALRSVRLVLATLVTLVVGLVLTAGFTALAIGHFNLISVSFAVLFIGLGVDFGIHLCMRYRELRAAGAIHADALLGSSRDVGSSIALCALTTAIGFFAFVPTDIVGVAELGLISGAGMFISLFCTVTLLPALLSLPPVPSGGRGGVTSWSGTGLAALPLRYPRAVRALALALGLGAVLLLPEARFDNNPLNVRDPSSESVRAFADLLEKGTSSPWSLNAVAPDLARAEALAGRLRELPEVGRVVTVTDFVPENQEEKLGIISDVAMFLPPLPGPDGVVPEVPVESQLAALEDLATALARLESNGSPELRPAARELRTSLGAYLAQLRSAEDPANSIESLEESVVGALPEQLRVLEAALSAGRVTLENLPDVLLERMTTEDGRVRIQIFPSADLSDHEALADFVDAVRDVTPEVAGSASEIVESGRTVVRALRRAMLSALCAITLFLLLLWRRLDDAALVLLPLGLAAALTVAASVLADIPFNFADVIVLPLLLGIGVDSGIHLVHRARTTGEVHLLGTSTARAVAFSALTTIASFGTLGLASHRGLATLGQLLTLGVGFTILCNLVVLPALLVLRERRDRVPRAELADRAG